MKNFKKIASAIAALSLAACMVAPVATMTSFAADGKGSITITDEVSGHIYTAYKIFSAKSYSDTDGTLGNIEWADNVTQTGLYDALASITTKDGKKPFTKKGGDGGAEDVALSSAKEVVDVLSAETNKEDNSEVAKAFAQAIRKFVGSSGTSLTATDGGYKADLDYGYYLVEQTGLDADANDAYTRFILEVAGDATATVKKDKPTVDKQVFDDNADDNSDQAVPSNTSAKDNGSGWGETADHTIGETFQFKLKAKLPNNAEIDEYKSYKLVFHDSWSDCVDFVGNVTLTVGSKVITLDTTNTKNEYYELNADKDKLTVTIKDVRLVEGVTSLQDLDVSVVYDAKLNDKAVALKTATGTTTNENKVYLEYSNNPNVTGSGETSPNTGKTPEDSVWVFTYEVDTLKTKGDSVSKSDPLPGAEFTLKKQGESSNLSFKYDDAKKAYVVGSGAGYSETLTSKDDGTFNFYGLDAGTYILTETKAPNGYNLAEDVTVTITATHQEDTDSTNSANLTIKSTQGSGSEQTIVGADADGDGKINIIDEKGATLPSTGGIGTTLFYLGGGALVAVAGVMLITKKRMTKE